MSIDRRRLRELFDDNEIVIVESVRGLTEAIERFKADPETRARMSEAAYKRVLSEHTYEHRMKRALVCLGLNATEAVIHAAMPTIADLRAAAYGDSEMQSFLTQFDDTALARLTDLVARIPAGQRDLTRAELIIMLMHEFRQWGVEKSAIR
ncbi:MAG: glycosyltransferase family 1 protein [bacterium]|nr:glycosyltransferase family 1 protein [bacterium]